MTSRILSAIIAIAYLTFIYLVGGAGIALRLGLFLVLPLACIWFSEGMGSFTGSMRGHSISTPTPGCLVAFGGWLLLLLPLILALIQLLSGSR